MKNFLSNEELDYDIINLDSKHPFAQGYVKPAF